MEAMSLSKWDLSVFEAKRAARPSLSAIFPSIVMARMTVVCSFIADSALGTIKTILQMG
jgi:hypothetical protein